MRHSAAGRRVHSQFAANDVIANAVLTSNVCVTIRPRGSYYVLYENIIFSFPRHQDSSPLSTRRPPEQFTVDKLAAVCGAFLHNCDVSHGRDSHARRPLVN